MYDVEDFDKIFDNCRYSPALVSAIQENQHVLGGRTFFERLLELLGIKCTDTSGTSPLPAVYRAADTNAGRRMYPPKDDATFAELHTRIVAAPITLHYKYCLVFYLLKDLSPSHHRDVEIAADFAGNVHLDKRFWTFIEGIWELDHLAWETAVENLTYPGLIPTFPDEILMALLGRGEKMGVGGAEGGKDALPAAYFECVRPPLGSDAVRDKFARYMAQRNVTETYYWIRTRPDPEHYGLLEILFEQTLAQAPAPTAAVYPREVRAEELVGLPFTEEEEDWMEEFLTVGKGRTLRGAEDTVQLRRLAGGRFADFAKEGVKGKKVDGVNWETLRDGVRRGVGGRIGEEGYVG